MDVTPPSDVNSPVVLQAIAFDAWFGAGLSDEIRVQFINTLISTGIYGVFAACITTSMLLLVSKRRRNATTIILLFSIFVMCACTTFYWALGIYNTFLNVVAAIEYFGNISRNVACLLGDSNAYVIPGEQCQPGTADAGLFSGVLPTKSCAGTAALTINVVLGDAIVWWRACVIRHETKAIRTVAVAILLETLAMGAVSTSHSCTSSNGYLQSAESGLPPLLQPGAIAISGRYNALVDGFAAGSLFQGDGFGITASVLSLVSNIFTTVLVWAKAWEHRVLIRDHLRSMSGSSQVQRALMLLVESGFVYCVIWIFVVAYQILAVQYLQSIYPSIKSAGTSFTAGFEVFTESALVIVIPIYPTIIIILVALNKSQCETVVSLNNSHGILPIESLIFNRPSPHATETVVTNITQFSAATNPPPLPPSPAVGREHRESLTRRSSYASLSHSCAA